MFERRDLSRRTLSGSAGTLLLGLTGVPTSVMAQSGSPGPANPLYIQMIPFVLIIVIFYFLVLRPQQKRQQALQKLIEGLRKGDRVLTGGGVYGTVHSIKDDTVVLEIGKGVLVEFAKSAVTSVVPSS